MKLKHVVIMNTITFLAAGPVWDMLWKTIQVFEQHLYTEQISYDHQVRRLHGAAGSADYTHINVGRIETEVVMFVPSPVPWEERRQHVYKQFAREGWSESQVVLLFVFGNRSGDFLRGSVNVSSATQYPLATNVVVNCRDFGDEFNNPDDTSATTCKVYKSLQYIAAHYKAKYVWRGADDSYINMKYFFLNVMPDLPTDRLYFGSLRTVQGIRSDLLLSRQPKLQSLFGMYQFGHYMYGSGYVLSFDVVDFVVSLKIPPHLTWCEDVMVGMWLNPFQIEFKNSLEFIDQAFGSATIGKDYLLIHRMLPEQWSRINAMGQLY
jgi:hypothetical protein